MLEHELLIVRLLVIPILFCLHGC